MTELERRYAFALGAAKYCGTQEGTAEHRALLAMYNSIVPLPRNHRITSTEAWCAAFVSAVAQELGLLEIIPVECSCSAMIAQAKAAGIWEEHDSYVPKAGDLLMYDWQANGKGDNRGAPDHVGIVLEVRGNTIFVVEGNYNDAVGIRRVPLDGQYIRGFVCPNFRNMNEKEEMAVIQVKVLKRGMKEEQVRSAQSLLNLRNDAGLDTDGSFGPATEKAVRAYQKKKGLSVTGEINQETWNTLMGI